MAKAATVFECSACGSRFPKWAGRCPDCGAWDTLEELRLTASPGGGNGRAAGVALSGAERARPLAEVDPAADPGGDRGRLHTGIAEADRVLGGGLVPGSAVLVGGDPGVGKSTLWLQAAAGLAHAGSTCLYVACEESAAQVRLRADRLLADPGLPDGLLVCAETQLGRVLEQVRVAKPAVVVVDSIQMVDAGVNSGVSGGMNQLRQAGLTLIREAKSAGFALVLIGHVTKGGGLAGPKLLEHMVDAVLRFEGDRYHAHRVLRAVKNRFGPTLELGLFEMTGAGLREAADGAGVAAAEHEARPGAAVTAVLQGSRCLVVEVQALTVAGFLGAAKRKVSGLDSSRLAMLIAVLERHGGLRLADQDVFASAVGGVKVAEPAADLAAALAVAGAFVGRKLPARCAVLGEVGLGGEVRPVLQLDRRVAEASKLGFTSVVGPAGVKPPRGVEWIGVRRIADALEQLV